MVPSAENVPVTDTAPEYCRVSAMIAPVVALKANRPVRWNHRFFKIGDGGVSGEPFNSPPRTAALTNAVKHGYVMAMTNTGHDASREPLCPFPAEARYDGKGNADDASSYACVEPKT